MTGTSVRRGTLAGDERRARPGAGAIGQALAIGVALAVSVALLGYGAAPRGGTSGAGEAGTTSRAERAGRAGTEREAASYGTLPLSFEENRGQTGPGVRYLARGSGYTLFLGATEATLALRRGQRGTPAAAADTVRMQIVGADAGAEVRGRAPLPGKVNYLVGNDPSRWRTGIPTYGRVTYDGVYPGIDLVYYGRQGELEYDFVVAPGADPGMIALRFDGVENLAIAPEGDLVLRTAGGELRQRTPVLYQDVEGSRRAVEGRFVLRADREVGFAVGAYDRARTLVIDPVLGYSTYLGGGGVDVGFGIAVDSAGSAYVAGQTTSSNFPTKGAVSCSSTTFPTSSYQCDRPGGDAFVTKLSPDGATLVYSTYFGGGRTEQAWDVAIDATGSAYVAGSTDSADLPMTASAFDSTCGSDGTCNAVGSTGVPDAFVARFSPAGDALLYSTYLGGAGPEEEINGTALPSHMGVAVFGTRAYVASQTGSDDDPLTVGVDEGFPTTANAFQRTCGTLALPGCDNGSADAFVSVLDTAAAGPASLVYSSYLGGSGDDQAKGVAVDGAGSAFVVGTTAGILAEGTGAQANNFPTKRALRPLYAGGVSDAFVAKFSLKPGSSAADTLVYSTYLGGGGIDQAWAVDVDHGALNKAGNNKGGRPVVTGFTDSGDDPATPAPDGPVPYFPTTAGAYDTTFNGRATAPDGTTTFISGDAFVARLDSDGGGLAYSTFLGGADGDTGGGVALDSAGNVYVTGYTTCENLTLESPDAPCVGTFPVTADAPQPNMNGVFIGPFLHNSPTDVFVAKLDASAASLVYGTYLGGNDFDRGFAIAVRDRDVLGAAITPEAYVTGRMASTDYPVTSGAFRTTKPAGKGNRDAAVSKLVG